MHSDATDGRVTVYLFGMGAVFATAWVMAAIRVW